MNNFTPKINTVYPQNNLYEFERWFGDNYSGCDTEREYIKVYWCGFQVNHNYGQDKAAMKSLQEYVNGLPKDKKYFTISQYDLGVGVDWNGLDVLEFNMSKKTGVDLPLLCEPHPYKFSGEKKYLANFIGNRTHEIRNSAERYKFIPEYYISYDTHPIEKYCQIISESYYTLCYRGFGSNSFRIAEALQYGSIPVYISDEYITPFGIDFTEYGILITPENSNRIDEILQSVPYENILKMQERGKEVYMDYYTYDGALKKIITHLENAPKT